MSQASRVGATTGPERDIEGIFAYEETKRVGPSEHVTDKGRFEGRVSVGDRHVALYRDGHDEPEQIRDIQTGGVSDSLQLTQEDGELVIVAKSIDYRTLTVQLLKHT